MTPSSETMTSTTGHVLHWAARYDVLVWLLTRGNDRAFREKLVRLAQLAPGESVLDVGCGTGSLAIAARRQVGATGEVFGIDASPAMVRRATSKAAKARLNIRFELGGAERLPFDDRRFDAALSTLMLHHLPRKARQQCVREIGRVLKPGGRALFVDFSRRSPRGLLARFHRHGHVESSEIVSLVEDAGLRTIDTGSVGVSSLHYVLARC